MLAHVDTAELLQEAHGVLRRGGASLKLIERRPVGAGAVGQKLGGENLPERRVVAAPAHPGQVEIQCRGALFVFSDCAHRASTGIGTAQHQLADTVGMASGVGHRDGAALRYPQQREALQPERLDDRLEIVDPVLEAEICCIPIG